MSRSPEPSGDHWPAGRRLLVINSSGHWGGNEHWAVQVASGMAARGVQTVFLWSHEDVGERVAEAGLDHHCWRARGDADAVALLRLRNIVGRLRPHAVLPTRWREYLHGGLVARVGGRPRPRVVLRIGLNQVPREDMKRRLVFRLADRIIVNAPEIRDSLLVHPWIRPAKVAVVLNGLELGGWRPRWHPEMVRRGQDCRLEFGVPDGVPLLIAAGAFSLQKDFASLLRAFAEVRRRQPAARLLLVGDGPLWDSLVALRAELGLESAVLMPGFRRDINALMAAADLFVLSSDNEGMARVLVEAAASGLPAVATDVSGTRFAVEDGRNGLVVPPRDWRALATALVSLLNDRSRRDAMGREARALAEERFDAERMLDETSLVLFGGQRPGL